MSNTKTEAKRHQALMNWEQSLARQSITKVKTIRG